MKLIKSFCCLAATCLCFALAHAQTATVVPKIGGFRIGTSLTKIKANESLTSNNEVLRDLAGLAITVFLERPYSEKVSLQTELSFLNRGFRITSDYTYRGTTSKIDVRAVLNFLELTLLPKYRFGDQPSISLFAGAGLNFALSGKTKASTTINNKTTKTETKLDFAKDKMKRFDLSVPFGASIGYRIGKFDLVGDVRYMVGLVNFSIPENADDKFRSWHRGLAISVGGRMPLTF